MFYQYISNLNGISLELGPWGRTRNTVVYCLFAQEAWEKGNLGSKFYNMMGSKNRY